MSILVNVSFRHVFRPGSTYLQDIVSSGALGLGGDILCQFGIERRDPKDFNYKRAGALTAFNMLYIGGFLHFVYKSYPMIVAHVGRRVGSAALQRSTVKHNMGCSVVDNIHCGLIYIPAYFLGVASLQGDDTDDAKRALRAEWVTTYVTCSCFWLPYTYLNFANVPAGKRVQFMALGNLVWSVFIDFLAHRDHGESCGPPLPDPALAATNVAGRRLTNHHRDSKEPRET